MTDYGKQLFSMVQQDAYEIMAQAVKEAQRENALEYQRKIREIDAILGEYRGEA